MQWSCMLIMSRCCIVPNLHYQASAEFAAHCCRLQRRCRAYFQSRLTLVNVGTLPFSGMDAYEAQVAMKAVSCPALLCRS